MTDMPGVHLAPNIQGSPDIYEIENNAVDPEQRIEAAMQAILPWAGKTIVDCGAGTGFHIPRFSMEAQHVIAVEPHGASRLKAMARAVRLSLENVSIIRGSAEKLLLPDHSVDIVHARFAYFFAPDCGPGVAELARVIRPGGAAFIIDNDLDTGTFAGWLRRVPSYQAMDGRAIENWWAAQGFASQRIISEWRFESRADLEAVVRIEFPHPAGLADAILAEHKGTRVEYHYRLYYRRY